MSKEDKQKIINLLLLNGYSEIKCLTKDSDLLILHFSIILFQRNSEEVKQRKQFPFIYGNIYTKERTINKDEI